MTCCRLEPHLTTEKVKMGERERERERVMGRACSYMIDVKDVSEIFSAKYFHISVPDLYYFTMIITITSQLQSWKYFLYKKSDFCQNTFVLVSLGLPM